MNLICSMDSDELKQLGVILNEKSILCTLAARKTTHQRVKNALVQLMMEETAKAMGIPTSVAEGSMQVLTEASMDGTRDQIKFAEFYSDGRIFIHYS